MNANLPHGVFFLVGLQEGSRGNEGGKQGKRKQMHSPAKTLIGPGRARGVREKLYTSGGQHENFFHDLRK